MRKRQITPEKKNKKKAHLLLGIYWIGSVLSGRRISDTTKRVLQVQRNSLKKEYTNKLKAKRGEGTGNGTPAKKASAGVPKRTALYKMLGMVAKSQRIV